MSRKFLIVLVLVVFLAMGMVAAEDNSSGKVMADNSDGSLNSIDEPVLGDDDDGLVIGDDDDDDDENDDDDTDDDDDEYDEYESGIISAKKLTTTYNSGKAFNVKVIRAYDKSYELYDVKVKVRVYTGSSYKDYYAFTDEDGIAKFKLSGLALGKHKVIVSSADDFTDAKSVVSSVTISKAKTKVTAPKLTAKFKKSKSFKIRIVDKATGKGVKGVKIGVKVGSKKLYLLTNSKGVASFKTKAFKKGTYSVLIKSKNPNYSIHGKSKLVIK